jgi:hypothetical protein
MWGQKEIVNLNTKYPHLGNLSFSLSVSIHTLGHNLVTRQNLPIPCPRATDPVAGWLALLGVAILFSLSAPFSLSAHLVPITNQKMPRISKCPKSRGVGERNPS